MFAILVPVCLAPLIVVLFWAERRASQAGIVQAKLNAQLQREGASSEFASTSRSTLDLQSLRKHERELSGASGHAKDLLSRARRVANQMDLIGLCLLGSAITFVLLPLTLSNNIGLKGWRDGKFILILVHMCLN